MFTEHNLKKSILKKGHFGILVKGKYKFSIWRSVKLTTMDDFLQLANRKFIEKYGVEWSGKCRGRTRLTEYDRIINGRWSSINQRASNGKYSASKSATTSPQIVSYHNKNVTLQMTFTEFRDWMLSVKEIHEKIVKNGDKSSIDRIDDSEGYKIGNLQLISLHENIEKRIGKKCKYLTDDKKIKSKEANKNQYQKSKNLIKCEVEMGEA